MSTPQTPRSQCATLPAILCLFCFGLLTAQAVQITGFSPTTGPVGTTVTITGSGFSQIAEGNVVMLSNLRATVTSASESNLVITIPLGANYSPISVTVSEATAVSGTAFNTTFPTRGLDASAFDSALTFSPGDGPIATRLGDLDGDGRPDLAVAFFYDTNVVVYRNVGTGSVAGVFGEALKLPSPINAFDLHISDIDTDGKLDLITMDFAQNGVSVYRNTSSNGTLSFAPRVSFPANFEPHNGAVGDIDGDGKPEIISTSYAHGNIAVLRNTSSAGNVAFASPVIFPNLPAAHGVGVQDLDGDGRAEVVVSSHMTVSPGVHVLRNVSPPGSITTSSLQLTAQLDAGGTYVVFADFDSDTRPEIVTCSWYTHDVTVFPNLSTNGFLHNAAFGTPIHLPSAGSTKRMAVGDLDGDGRVDLAFPTELGDSLGFRKNLGGSNTLDSSWFGPRVDLPAGWNGDGISIGDVDLDGFPDIVFCSFYVDEIWVYRGVQPTAPAIVNQPTNTVLTLGGSGAISVTATGGGLSYKWFRNGQQISASSSTVQIFNANSTHAGEYYVIVSNAGGSVTSAVATVTVTVARTFVLSAVEPVVEGDLVTTTLSLISTGDVAGFGLNISTDLRYLGMPTVIWDSSLDGAFKEFNTLSRGGVRLAVALPATSIPAGTQVLAQIQFRARTVVQTNVTTPINLTVSDVSDAQGNSISSGTDRVGSSVTIGDAGFLLGDNNANHQLDVGDATLLLRLITQADSTRSWDLAGNDFNANQNIDSGDAIRMLRIIAGLDTPPSPPNPPTTNFFPSPKVASSELAALSPARLTGSAGQLVNIQLRLADLRTLISGASFTLHFPTQALRLVNAQGHRVSPNVPSGTVAVWNVAPQQNNYESQSGQLTLALSGSTPWFASNAALAEFTFQVQPGAATQHLWPLTISALEVTENGFNNRTLNVMNAHFVGRPAVSTFGSLSTSANTARFVLQGDAGAGYRIEYSDDLKTWKLLEEILGFSGSREVIDQNATTPQRFYRSIPLP